MVAEYVCKRCQKQVPPTTDRCPVCGETAPFPNVRAASESAETKALKRRYQSAIQDSERRGTKKNVLEFERAVEDSKAVVSRPLNELMRLAHSENELYSSYYSILDAGLRLPKSNRWDTIREAVDSAMFPGYRDKIRFAALSLDGVGLTNYGDCFLILNTDYIAHRATVFERNSVLFMDERGIRMTDADQLPRGFRALWEARQKLAVAKLARQFAEGTEEQTFPSILLRQGKTSEHEDFIEVHIWGAFAIQTVERVIVAGASEDLSAAMLRKLEKRLQQLEVEFEMA